MGKLYSLISALLLTVSATFAATPDSYEWWFDDDVSAAQTGAVTGSSVELQIDTSELPKGIHYFNMRLSAAEVGAGTPFRKMFHSFGEDKAATSYIYWFDDDLDSAQSGALTDSVAHLDIDTSALPKGLHYFNLRLSSDEGIYGAPYRKLFHALGEDKDAITYEYWYDEDFTSRVKGDMPIGSRVLSLDITTLPQGAHYFNCRVGYGDGTWGPVYHKMVLNLAGNVNATAYEYWIDDNYDKHVSGDFAFGENTYIVDLTGVKKGLHRFNYRLRTGEGIWGATYTSYFYSASNDSHFTHYEYWLDNDYTGRKIASATGNPVSFEVDLSGFDKTGGVHYFNLRARDDDGEWGTTYRKLLIFTQEDVPVIGYRQFINGSELDYVKVERVVTDTYMFDAVLPDSLSVSVKGKRPVFEGERVTINATDSIDYRIQIATELGLAPPVAWKLEVGNEYSASAVEIAVNSSHEFTTPAVGEFAALKFISAGVPLYFRTDIPISLDLYKEGEKVAEVSAEQLAGMATLNLEAGEYFGILRDAEGEVSEWFTFHLMDTPNLVPMPVITYEEETVTISCSRKDAVIRYTLDGKDPDGGCTLYSEPFELKRNATIKAKAWVEGSDIEPSAVAEYVIDTYKTVAPVAEFDLAKRLLTLTSETKDASIFYTHEYDPADSLGGVWTDYKDPIQIRKNGTVYSRATFDGYKDSDITVTEITALPDSVPMPLIEFENGIVTISCGEKDAEIHYTLDGNRPTAGSTLYTGAFPLRRNATVMAMAFVPGLDIDTSRVATQVIDSYKVATPKGSFDVKTRLLTLTCDTVGASISYSFDRDGDWTEYSGPIAITRNCTVYAKATRDGYNESDIAEIPVTELADSVAAPKIDFADGTVTITCATADAEIHYTVDDANLTAESPIYTGPFALDRNATVRAFALIPGLDIEPSGVTTKVVDSYKVADPTGSFDAAKRELTINCATDGAKILYSFDRDGDWTEYSGPIAITKNCTVYAKATRDGYNDSDISEIAVTELADSVAAPTIDFTDGTVTITCATADAEIHYTIDDADLTAESPLYTGPFRLERNATVRAFALIPGLDIEPSGVTTKVVDSYKVADPTGSFDAARRELTLRCSTDGATIFYSFDPEGGWTEYSGPISITKNCTVYAKATRDGYNDSDIAEIVVSDMRCAGVSFSYHGHYLHIETEEDGATILYTSGDSDPADGTVYDGDIDVKGLGLIRAVAVKDGYLNSDPGEILIDYYADEVHAETAAEGLLASAFDWDDTGLPNNVTDFRIEGRLNDADYEFIRSMGALRHLDLEKVAEARIPKNAFRDSKLISISLPEDLASCGDSILSGAQLLSSVVWNSRTTNVSEGMTRGLANPNVLLYVPAETNVSGRSDLNIVKEGSEPAVTLHYGHPFFAARDFRADRVSLTHDFRQTTVVDTCRGWETVVLPFSPTEITHEVNGPAVPFAAWNEDLDGDKPFWLYRAVSGGWEASPSIEACVPYIISMPNNPDYVKEFNLGGKVTFSAEGVDLGPDSSFAKVNQWVEGTLFEGTFMPVEDNSVLSLNVGSTEGNLQPGSTFVPDGLTVPFGAYISGAARKAMPLFGGTSSVDLPLMVDAGLLIETPAPGTLRICSGRERRVAVTTATGVTIRTLRLKPGEAVTLEGLTRDLYIVGGRKVMVR